MRTAEREGAIDRITKVRRVVFPRVHRLKQRFGGYAECTMHPDEYVGTVQSSLSQFHFALRSMGFRREPVAALKRHRDGRRSAGSWVSRRSPFAAKQLHVTVFASGRESVDAYAHWEHSWLRHPYKHYRGIGWNTEKGVSKMRSLLSEHEVTFRIDSSAGMR